MQSFLSNFYLTVLSCLQKWRYNLLELRVFNYLAFSSYLREYFTSALVVLTYAHSCSIATASLFAFQSAKFVFLNRIISRCSMIFFATNFLINPCTCITSTLSITLGVFERLFIPAEINKLANSWYYWAVSNARFTAAPATLEADNCPKLPKAY